MAKYEMEIGSKMKQVPITEDFETICICAIRYSLGRQTYMPTLAMEYITPMLPEFGIRALSVLENALNDYISNSNPVNEYDAYLNEKWLEFFEKVKAAYNEKRGTNDRKL